jgi:hypothetical protein
VREELSYRLVGNAAEAPQPIGGLFPNAKRMISRIFDSFGVALPTSIEAGVCTADPVLAFRSKATP